MIEEASFYSSVVTMRELDLAVLVTSFPPLPNLPKFVTLK